MTATNTTPAATECLIKIGQDQLGTWWIIVDETLRSQHPTFHEAVAVAAMRFAGPGGRLVLDIGKRKCEDRT